MNLSFTSSLKSSPDRVSSADVDTDEDAYNAFIYNTDFSPKDPSTRAQVQSFPSSLTLSPPGHPEPNVPDGDHPVPGPKPEIPEEPAKPPSYFTPARALKTYLNPPPSIPPSKPKPQAPLRLQDKIFCGLRPPCPCLAKLRPPQLQILPAHYPIYLPVGELPCGQDCGNHHTHGDNLHPPNPSMCPCDPPRLDPGSAFHHQVAEIHFDDDLYLPPDFSPCGPRCAYEDCGCLRQYEGRDWMS